MAHLKLYILRNKSLDTHGSLSHYVLTFNSFEHTCFSIIVHGG